VFKGKTVHQQPISSLLTLRKRRLFSFSTPLCTIRPYTARPSCKTLLSMKSALEQNHSIDVLLATIQHPVLVQPRNLALPESDSQNLDSSRWSLIENFRQKSVSNHAFKNNSARKLRCLIQSFYQSLIKKRIIMLNKTNQKKNLWKYALVVPFSRLLCCFK
jgi:hypothetical protein